MKDLAKSMIEGIKMYYNSDPKSLQVASAIEEKIGELIELERDNKDEGGSESDPSADEIDIR